NGTPAATSAFVMWKLPLPTTPNTCAAPAAAIARPIATATVTVSDTIAHLFPSHTAPTDHFVYRTSLAAFARSRNRYAIPNWSSDCGLYRHPDALPFDSRAKL